jgi:hypothetical protein
MNAMEINVFVPIYGSYYHFITESALGLFRLLQENNRLESRDCNIWYQGGFGSIVQMFSCRPIMQLPFARPFLRDPSSLGKNVFMLQHRRLTDHPYGSELIPLRDYLSNQIPFVSMEIGVTIIQRNKNRSYQESGLLAESLQSTIRLPVRVVCFETLSFSDQVNLARNTALLIAPHGAGTLNQIFMPKGSSIIELFPLGYQNSHAQSIAKAFGYQWVEIESEKPGVVGRMRDENIDRYITDNGWPTRLAVDKQLPLFGHELRRTVRDVASFSIDPAVIVQKAKYMLKQTNHHR